MNLLNQIWSIHDTYMKRCSEGFTGRGRRHWKVLQFCSDENQQNIQNLSGAVEKPATNVMSLWSGMIVSCYSLPEKWKWCRFDCSNQHGNMGDDMVNLPKNEEYPRTQKVTKGKQRILKFWFWRNGTARDNPHSQFAAVANISFQLFFFGHVGLTTCLGPVHSVF